MIETGFIKSFDGTSLYYRLDGVDSPRGLIVVCHGLAEHHRRYDALTAFFTQHRFAVLRFDQRGHGQSSGERGYFEDAMTLFDDLREVVHFAQHKHIHPLLLLGHSLGAYGVLGYAMHYPNQVEGLLLSAPLSVDYAGIAQSVSLDQDPHQRMPNGLGSLICSDPVVVKAYEQDPQVLHDLPVGTLQAVQKNTLFMQEHLMDVVDPFFVLHGENDQIVSKKDSELLYERARSEDTQIAIYPDMMHEILNEPDHEVVFDDLLEWIEERLEEVSHRPTVM